MLMTLSMIIIIFLQFYSWIQTLYGANGNPTIAQSGVTFNNIQSQDYKIPKELYYIFDPYNSQINHLQGATSTEYYYQTFRTDNGAVTELLVLQTFRIYKDKLFLSLILMVM